MCSSDLPLQGSLIVLWDTISFCVHPPQIVLGMGMPLFSSKGEPLQGSLIVLWDTLPFVVYVTQIGLGRGIPLFGSKGVPLHRSLIVLWDTLPFAIHHSQIELGIGIPLFSKGSPFTQSSCEVTTIVCRNSLLEISTPTRPNTSKKNGKGQADGENQV